MPPLLAESAVGGGAPGRLLWWAWMTSKGSRWRKELPTVAPVFTHIHTPGCVCSDGNMERLMVAGSWVRTLVAGGGLFEFVAGTVPEEGMVSQILLLREMKAAGAEPGWWSEEEPPGLFLSSIYA
ncbi:hypothetical protein E3N88_40252 [Mikania micrantha]|uniref:Uncharacterized protein n=1 Tax=Mikania micrantha TaxID=192012 RepID=A0A5N6LM77_9ASTR|nr:hypothetical protein E3N88_40252 [Mikania micrantha]